MTDHKPVAPEFGPNGAVMNSPNMTEKMRDKIERSEPSNGLPKSMQWLFAALSMLSVCLVGGGMLLRTREPGIALMLALSGVVVVLIRLIWRALALKGPRRHS